MAKSEQANHSPMTAKNAVTEILSCPLASDWTIEALVERVLAAIALQPLTVAEAGEIVLDADKITDRQSRRLLRPLLACLARKSADEGGTCPTLYEGSFAFERPGQGEPVWIVGEFKNMPGQVRATFRRHGPPPKTEQAIAERPHYAARDR